MQFDQVNFGDLSLTTFRLAAGEKIPEHAHTDESGKSHATIIAAGRVRLTGDSERDLEPGEVLDFAPGVVHGFVALEDGAVVINAFRDTTRLTT